MLTSKRFYFIRAWYDWMTANKLTPHIVVDATYTGVKVPNEYIENDRIILEIANHAVNRFIMNPQYMTFDADFDAVGIFSVVVPIPSIVAIYAEENKEGGFFSPEENSSQQSIHHKPAFTVVE